MLLVAKVVSVLNREIVRLLEGLLHVFTDRYTIVNACVMHAGVAGIFTFLHMALS